MSNSAELGGGDEAKLEALADEAISDRISGVVYWIALIYGGFGILVAMNQTFSWDAFGYVLVDNANYYTSRLNC